jgi:GNAT superfamily N-acetyltransferase
MPQDLVIVELDPHDDRMFDAWHSVYWTVEHHDRPDTTTAWSLDQLRALMQEDARRQFNRGFVGTVDDRVVTMGIVGGSLLDNLTLCEVNVATLPDHREQGHGSAMLEHLEDVARELGRTTAMAEAHWPYEADPNGVGEPAVDWASRRGYAVGLVDVQRRLPLPVDERLLDELAAEAAEHHAGYTLRSWVGPVPDELLQGWADLTSTLMTEAPMGELEREPEAADVDAVREAEALVVKQGRTTYNTVALSQSGDLVAYTNIAVTRLEPERAYQWGTLVRADHRGHGLGLAVKVENLRLLQREQPDTTTVVTWNAEINSHMVGVNQRLGFQPVERFGELHKKLA